MREPSPRTSRLAIAGSLAAILVVGGGGFLIGRGTAPAPVPVVAPAPPTAPPPVVEAPAERMLQRSDLLSLGAAAADAVSSGRAITRETLDLAGKRFELSLPFGCDGPAPEGSEAPVRWRYDVGASALRVHVAPSVWNKADWWEQPPARIEAMEGFWIERPWSSADACSASPSPATAPGIDPVTLPGQTLGIVQLVSPETPRQVLRGDKPYEAVVRVAPDALKVDKGFRIHLKGRIARFPDGQPAQCRQPGGREQRPICLVAVTIEEVSIQNPATGETISVWQPTVGGRGGAASDG